VCLCACVSSSEQSQKKYHNMAFNFGILSAVDGDVATIAFICTIVFLIAIENLTRGVENLLQGSEIYNKMLQKIYKELMIMGFVSFTVAMYQAFKHPEETDAWFTAIDFVGYVLFFVAIFFVAHSLYIMTLSMISSNQYAQMHATSLADTLDIYDDSQRNMWSRFLFHMRYLPFSSARRKVEFKIIYALFRDTYWLPGDFDYGAYLSGCLASYSLNLINIENGTWAIMVILCLLNYARMRVFGNEMWNCEGFKFKHSAKEREDELDEDPNYVPAASNRCIERHVELFFICGSVMCLYVFLLHLLGKYYETELMGRAGVTSTADYEDFLTFVETNHIKADTERMTEAKVPMKKQRRRSQLNTKKNIEQMRRRSTVVHPVDRAAIIKMAAEKNSWKRPLRNIESAMRRVTAVVTQTGRNAGSYLHSSPTQKDGIIFRSFDSTDDNDGKGTLQRVGNINAQPSIKHKKRKLSLGGSMKACVTTSFFKRGYMDGNALSLLKNAKDSPGLEKDVKLSEDFSSVFLFDNPDLFFRAVEIAIMLNSLYLSLWITNFISAVNQASIDYSYLWQIFMLVPLFLVLPSIGAIVKVASLISAIAQLDIDVIGTIAEAKEENDRLCSELRAKILSRVKGERMNQKDIIRRLFDEIDTDGSGTINKFEFRDMLAALRLHYSDEKYIKLFAQVDVNKSGSLTIDELNKLIFPDDAIKEDVQV